MREVQRCEESKILSCPNRSSASASCTDIPRDKESGIKGTVEEKVKLGLSRLSSFFEYEVSLVALCQQNRTASRLSSRVTDEWLT